MFKLKRLVVASPLLMAGGMAADAQVPAANTLTAAERKAGWTLLFDGRDLSGWRSFAGGDAPATWRVQDGAIELVKDDGQMSGTDLVTAKS